MKYIIAVVDGTRFDLAPKFESRNAKMYAYGTFKLIVGVFGDYDKKYDETYNEVAEYVKKVNAEFKHNNYYKGAFKAEMLTPNEHGEYNDSFCDIFRNWLIVKILNADEINVDSASSNLQGRYDVRKDRDVVTRVIDRISHELFKYIEEPGSYTYKVLEQYYDKHTWYDLNHPTFEFGYSSTISIQIIDRRYDDVFKNKLTTKTTA